jgi:hypothetical protein
MYLIYQTHFPGLLLIYSSDKTKNYLIREQINLIGHDGITQYSAV